MNSVTNPPSAKMQGQGGEWRNTDMWGRGCTVLHGCLRCPSSPALAGALSRAFDDVIPQGAYRPSLDAKGGIEWIKRLSDGTELRYAREPGTTLGQRLAVGFLALLPIEGLL